MSTRSERSESGAVSIFVVVFCMLLTTVITMSFVGVMLRSQQQVMSADLSDSAYDSALAGVEDAKRLLLRYRECVSAPGGAGCSGIVSAINSGQCDTVARGLYGKVDGSPVIVQRSQSDTRSESLNQSYTCVKIILENDNISGDAAADVAQLIPVSPVGSYSKIRVSWFTRSDAQKSGYQRAAVAGSLNGNFLGLPAADGWPISGDGVNPPILRAQWIQTGSTFSLDQFNTDYSGRTSSSSNSSTVFLYPRSDGSNTSFASGDPHDGRKSPVKSLCSNSIIPDGGYACSAEITLPSRLGSGARSNSHLQLTPLYGATSYKIEALNDLGEVVKLVRPYVDSTGRANDIYRRVLAEISFNSSLNGIRAGMEVNASGNSPLCKDFMVTEGEYSAGEGGCDY